MMSAGIDNYLVNIGYHLQRRKQQYLKAEITEHSRCMTGCTGTGTVGDADPLNDASHGRCRRLTLKIFVA